MRQWRWALAMLAAAFGAAGSQAAWHEASSAHFVVYSDDDAEDVRRYAADLEQFDKAMRVMRQLPDTVLSPSQRVTVYVVRDLGALQRLFGSNDAAGFYMPRVEGSVAFVPRTIRGRGDKLALSAQAVLLHEYAHHFMFSTWGQQAFPAWLVEGFAEFNATAISEPDRLLIGAMPLYRARGLIDTHLVPMRTLLTRSPQEKGFTDQQRQTFYGRAWLLTHYLTLGPQKGELLTDYLKALASGKPALEAAGVFGDLKKLDTALDRYATQRKLSAIGIKSSVLPIGPVAVRPLRPGEVAIMPVRMRSTRGVNRKTAADVVQDARRAAAAYADDPDVQVVLAEAEYDAGQFEAADAAAARALAARPKFTRAMMYRGMAQVAMARRDRTTDHARWQAIRRWFRQANAVDAEDPWPLVAFYHAYRASGEPVTANAEDGLDYAYRLAPFDRRVAMELAAMHLRHKRSAEASIPLRRVAYDPHGGQMAAMAGTMLAAIESGDAKTLDAIARTLGGDGDEGGKDDDAAGERP